MKEDTIYDVAIVGGGLAGLALSIQLARAGYRTILFEKEKYPFHRVCGEYISFESWNFLEELGVPLSDWDLPIIKRLLITSPGGDAIEQDLALGGFGISRYSLDHALAGISREAGVELVEEQKVTDVQFEKKYFTVRSADRICQARVLCGAYGKRSNLDVKWKRPFTRKKNKKLNNYVAVKYHVEIDQAADLIALHNFPGGYCGISRVDGNKYCLCYLTTARNLERCDNSIDLLEQELLAVNPHLRRIFQTAKKIQSQPLTISQISFGKKQKVENHLLFLGDAAGMITPLCGNGMSMALHGSKIAFESIRDFLNGNLARHEMEQQYADRWNRLFERRLRIGRFIQYFFGDPLLTEFFLRSIRPFPRLRAWLVARTHGQPF